MRRVRLCLVLLCALAMTGCSRTLFVRNQGQTTQFETYDRMRGYYTPKTIPDVFGTPQPALRERLSRRD